MSDEGFMVTDDGEILDVPYDVAALVRELYEARQQVKLWQQRAAILSQRLMEKQSEKVVEVDDLRATIVERVTADQDVDQIVEEARESELPREQLFELLAAAKSFDMKKLRTGELVVLIDRHTRYKNSSYIQVSEKPRKIKIGKST